MFTSSRPTFPKSDGISTELAGRIKKVSGEVQVAICDEENSVSPDCESKKRSKFRENREQRTEIARVRSLLPIHESIKTISLLLLSCKKFFDARARGAGNFRRASGNSD
jgi:hypothetical protein